MGTAVGGSGGFEGVGPGTSEPSHGGGGMLGEAGAGTGREGRKRGEGGGESALLQAVRAARRRRDQRRKATALVQIVLGGWAFGADSRWGWMGLGREKRAHVSGCLALSGAVAGGSRGGVCLVLTCPKRFGMRSCDRRDTGFPCLVQAGARTHTTRIASFSALLRLGSRVPATDWRVMSAMPLRLVARVQAEACHDAFPLAWYWNVCQLMLRKESSASRKSRPGRIFCTSSRGRSKRV